jgi:hypothetical protein
MLVCTSIDDRPIKQHSHQNVSFPETESPGAAHLAQKNVTFSKSLES